MNANRKRQNGREGYTLVPCQSLLVLVISPILLSDFKIKKDCTQSGPQGAEIQARLQMDKGG